jgi:hypothetical protein
MKRCSEWPFEPRQPRSRSQVSPDMCWLCFVMLSSVLRVVLPHAAFTGALTHMRSPVSNHPCLAGSTLPLRLYNLPDASQLYPRDHGQRPVVHRPKWDRSQSVFAAYVPVCAPLLLLLLLQFVVVAAVVVLLPLLPAMSCFVVSL